MEQSEILIIGGGLSGAAAGILLARHGFRPLILEKSSYPKNKVCGEFLSPGIRPLLRNLGVDGKIRDREPELIYSSTFSAAGGGTFESPLAGPGSDPALGISREALDSIFIEEAKRGGCEVLEHCEVQRIEKNKEGFNIKFSDLGPPHPDPLPQGKGGEGKSKYPLSLWAVAARDCPFVPVAPYSSKGTSERARVRGKNISASLVINAAGKFHRFCARCHPEGAEGDRRISESRFFAPLRMTTELKTGFKAHFEKIPGMEGKVSLFFFRGGYFGICNIENGRTNLCGMIDNAGLKEFRGNFDLLLADLSSAFPRLLGARRLSPWLACGPFGESRRRPLREEVFHAGDAAFFAEPFLGQGMTLAVASSFLLASLIKKYGIRGQDRIGREYGQRLAAVRRPKTLLSRFSRAFAAGAGREPGLLRLPRSFPRVAQFLIRSACAPPLAL